MENKKRVSGYYFVAIPWSWKLIIRYYDSSSESWGSDQESDFTYIADNPIECPTVPTGE